MEQANDQDSDPAEGNEPTTPRQGRCMLVWEWMKIHYLWSTFFLAVCADFWANWYSYAIVHDWIVLQAFLGLALPFINFPAMLFFFEHDDTLERFKICAVGAVAMMFGSTLMLLMIRSGIGVGSDLIP